MPRLIYGRDLGTGSTAISSDGLREVVDIWCSGSRKLKVRTKCDEKVRLLEKKFDHYTLRALDHIKAR